jgi:hypothetical protein
MNVWEKIQQGIRGVYWSITEWQSPHCVFCRKYKRGGETLKHISRYSGYETERYCYHEGCLRDVVNDPEAHGHRAVDLALDIVNCKELREQGKRRDAEWRAMKLQQIKKVRERMFGEQERP